MARFVIDGKRRSGDVTTYPIHTRLRISGRSADRTVLRRMSLDQIWSAREIAEAARNSIRSQNWAIIGRLFDK